MCVREKQREGGRERERAMETISERERESEHFLGAFGVKAGLEEDGRIVTGKGQERMGWGQKDKAFRVLYI